MHNETFTTRQFENLAGVNAKPLLDINNLVKTKC
jgi:hypothetical protein